MCSSFINKLNLKARFAIFVFCLIIGLLCYRYRILKRSKIGKLSEEIKTAIGVVSIREIESNVFLPNGYTLIDSGQHLVPIIKKIVPETCEEVFRDWQIVANRKPPPQPPKNMEPRDQFTLNGYMSVFDCYLDNFVYNVTTDKSISDAFWTEDAIENRIQNGKNNNLTGATNYHSMAVYYSTKYYSIKGKIGAVIGSYMPWVETACLLNGAKHLVTVDYQRLKIGHPKISFLHVYDIAKAWTIYQNLFEFVVTFSSIEHSGLGRYGDPLDPFGDIREVKKIKCMLKPGGLLFFGVPIGLDAIGFNCHRYYGRLRLAFAFEGFELLSMFQNKEWPEEMKLDDLYKEYTEMFTPYPYYVFVLKKI